MDKKNKINSEVKKRICKAVKNNKIIWDKTEKGHSNRNALKKAWERVAKEVGVNEQLCRNGWKSVRDSQRYHKKKTKASGSAGDIDMEVEYLSESSSEPWELQEDIEFLLEPSMQRTTDSTNIFGDENDDTFTEASTSSYSYKDSTPSFSKAKYFSGLAETGSQLADSMSKIVELAGREKSAHAGFLSHLSSIMDELEKNAVIELQSKIMQIAYKMLAENN